MDNFSNNLPNGYKSVSHRRIEVMISNFARFSDEHQWVALHQMLSSTMRLTNPVETLELMLTADEFIHRWRCWQEGLGKTQYRFTVRHIAVFGHEATCFVDSLVTSFHNPNTVCQWGGQFGFGFSQQADTWQIHTLDIVPLWISRIPQAKSVLAGLKGLLATTGSS